MMDLAIMIPNGGYAWKSSVILSEKIAVKSENQSTSCSFRIRNLLTLRIQTAIIPVLQLPSSVFRSASRKFESK